MDIRPLIAAAAAGLNIRIDPTYREEDRKVLLSDNDVKLIAQAVNRANVQTVESNRIRTLLGVDRRSPGAARELTEHDAQQLAAAIRFLGITIERDRRVSRGQYVGPMSGSEAMKFIRAQHGLR